MLIDFMGYSADCLISGKLDLTAPRLTDMLNDKVPSRSPTWCSKAWSTRAG